MSQPPDQQALRETAAAVAGEWELELGPPFSFARGSFAAPAGDGVVLKVSAPGDDEALHEPDALELWAGDGAVRLLRRDRSRRAFLIERARPGDQATVLPDEEATEVAVAVARRLWRPAGAPFREVGSLVPGWLDEAERRGGTGSELLPLARRLLAELRPRHDVLVHGDFHHHNLLRHGERWVAIDPKGFLGEPEYDVPSFLWNPFDSTAGRGFMPLERTRRRLAAFEAAGLDPWRMRAWTAIRGSYLGAEPDEVETILALLGD
jgi:streptomycin 6-kinase